MRSRGEGVKEINKERLAMYGTILEPGGAMFAPFYYPESERLLPTI